MGYNYDNLLEKIHLLTLHNRCRHFDALFLINVFSGTNCCPSVLEMVGLRVPTRNTPNFNMFTCFSSHCPSARWVSTANAVCILRDVFKNTCLSVNIWTHSFFFAFVVSYLFCPVLSYCCCLHSCWLCNWPLAAELST
jgi:hypothetical protein